jgi:hypothetical protein
MFHILFLVFLACSLVLAQGERATLNGTVTDPSGAAVPNAKVKILNKDTGVETDVTATETGVYRAPYLPPGTYRITASAPGFKSSVADNIVLHVAQVLTVDLTLQVGNLAEEVTVTAEAPLLESGTAEIGRYVTETEFDTWPIAVSDGQRQIQQFIFSSLPGTVGGTFQGSINGGQFYSHEILIEGIPLGRMDLQGGSNNEFSPSPESIAEFKLQTGTMDARYNGGQTAAANFAIKSGTNDLHGTLFSYIQNDVLRANSFANNALGRPRSPYKLFNYGGAAGGPVIIPKLYNGRNKTFWFVDLDANRVRDFTSIGLSTLPVRDFKRGDFSRLFDPAFTGRPQSGSVIGTDALGRPVRYGQIYDPSTTRMVNGQVVRDPFPNNIIPEARWSEVSRNILTKAPITDPLFDRMLNNIPNLAACCPVFDQRIIGVKGDHIINERHRISAYYNHTFRQRNNSPGGRWAAPPDTPTNVWQLQYTPGRLVRLAYDWTITPAVINHLAAGYNRFGNLNQSVFVDQGWPEKIGLRNVPPTHFPALVFQGQPHLGGGIGAGGRLGSQLAGGSYNGSTIVQDDLTIVRGSHNFKTGFELRRYYYNIRGRGNESGTFNFNSLQTQLPGFANETGHAFASFLLGAVASTNRSVVASFFGWRSSAPAFYFSDDWKVSRKLTLNLGLRWEVLGPLYEVAGRTSNFNPNLPNPAAGNRLGALDFADAQKRTSFQNWYFGQLLPRFGFAYAMSDKVVLRGGYGINSTPNIANGFGFPSSFGYNASINLNASNVPLQFPQDPVLYLHQPYPSFTATLPNRDPGLANGQGVSYVAPDSNRMPYVQNYHLGFQFAMPAQSVLEVAYIGNKGTRLQAEGLDNMNQLPVSALSLGDRLIERWTPASGVPAPFPGFGGSVAQALRPWPQYLGISQWGAYFGTSRYDSLQTTYTRHFRGGYGYILAYTWSKAISLVDDPIDGGVSQDVYNRALERSVTAYHIPHFFKGTWILDLPFGKGKLINLPGIAGTLFGGWRLTGIHNYRTGDALPISSSAPRTDALFNSQVRPDLVPGVPIVIDAGGLAFGTGTRYLNPAAFQQTPMTPNNIPLRLGTAPRRLPNVRGPARYTEDFGLVKQFVFTETRILEVRADFLNAFNRAGRGNPVTDVSSPQFGLITGPAFGPRNIQMGARFSW